MAEPPLKLIVVGTDGSDTAQIAVGEATRLARQNGAKLAILSAFKPVKADLAGARGNRESAAWEEGLSRSHVDTLLREAEIAAQAESVDVQTHAFTGDPADRILEFAERENADLIVVGNKGMTGSRRFLLGSVPDKITHHAPCSVLVVRTS